MKRSRIVAALAGAAAVVLGLTGTAASAHSGKGAQRQHGAFGYTVVRQGIPDTAARFRLASPDVHDGGSFPARFYADSFGCTGGNVQVRLSWSGAPAATRSYAVTIHDADAPTGSGFWHWLVWDIPSGSRALGAAAPTGTVSGTNDAGATGYLGPCPPAGDIPHHYQITAYALDVPSLGLPAGTPPAVTTFTMSSHIIGYARMTVTARR